MIKTRVPLRHPPAPPSALPGFHKITRYWDKRHRRFAAKLFPGQYYVTKNDEILVAVVGACVVVNIRCTKRGVSGMNQFLVPNISTSGEDKKTSESFGKAMRYGGFAMDLLIRDIVRHGGNYEDLEVKLIGGGYLGAHTGKSGLRTVEFIRDYATARGLHIVAEEVGDVYARKIVFDPVTGALRIKKITALKNRTLPKREFTYLCHISKGKQAEKDTTE